MGIGTLVHSLGSMYLSPMILTIKMYKEKACRIKNIRQALSNYDSNNTYFFKSSGMTGIAPF